MTNPTDPGGANELGAFTMDLVREHFTRGMKARLDANATFAVGAVADEVDRFGGTLVQVERGITGQELVDRIVAHLRALAEACDTATEDGGGSP